MEPRPSIALLFVFVTLFALASPAIAADGTVDVVVTINVLEDMVNQIGGEHVSVKSLVTGLENPHTYSTSAEDRTSVENADLFVEMGMGLEPWAGDLTVDLPAEKILVASDGCVKIGDNPHVWMDPENGKIIAGEIASALQKIDPNNAGDYRQNLAVYLEKLNSTERRIGEMLSSYSGNGVITQTPAFSYFLSRFNISEVDTVSAGPGKVPDTGDVMRMEEEIKSGKADVVIAMAQVNLPVIYQISSDTGAPVVTGTPLLGVMGINTYEDLLLYNAQALSSGLRNAENQKNINMMNSKIDSVNSQIGLLSIGFLALLVLSVIETYEILKMRRGDW